MSLSDLASFHLEEESHLPNRQHANIKQAILFFLSCASFIYIPLAQQYDDDAATSSFNTTETRDTFNPLGVCATALPLIYIAVNAFIDIHLNGQSIPKELENILDTRHTHIKFIKQNIVIGLFSTLSAAPFAIIAILFPPPISITLFICYVIYIQITNTALNFLSVELTLNHPIYGFFPKLLNAFWRVLTNNPLTDQEKAHLANQYQNRLIKQKMIDRIQNAKENFLIALTRNIGQIDSSLLNNYLNKSTGIERLAYLLSFEQQIEQSPNFRVNSARFIGATLVTTSLIGYSANLYVTFRNLLNSIGLAVLCSASPIYFSNTLLAYFGDLYGKRILYDVMLWKKGQQNLLIELRLSPFIMTIALVVNSFCMIYCASAAKRVMEVAFQSVVSKTMMTIMKLDSQIGLLILAWYVPLDFEKLLLRFVYLYYSQGPHQQVIEIDARLEMLKHDIARLKDEHVAGLIQEAPSSVELGIESSLSLPKNDQNNQAPPQNEILVKASFLSSCCSFMQGRNKTLPIENTNTNPVNRGTIKN